MSNTWIDLTKFDVFALEYFVEFLNLRLLIDQFLAINFILFCHFFNCVLQLTNFLCGFVIKREFPIHLLKPCFQFVYFFLYKNRPIAYGLVLRNVPLLATEICCVYFCLASSLRWFKIFFLFLIDRTLYEHLSHNWIFIFKYFLAHFSLVGC